MRYSSSPFLLLSQHKARPHPDGLVFTPTVAYSLVHSYGKATNALLVLLSPVSRNIQPTGLASPPRNATSTR